MPASTPEPEFSRSPRLLDRRRSALLVVDVQEKLLPVVRAAEQTLDHIANLLEVAALWKIPTLVSEQYPRGLGKTVSRLAELTSTAKDCEKLDFSCWGCEEFRQQLRSTDRKQIVVVGLETHVCIQQTVLDLLAANFEVFVVVDAVSARGALDHEIALNRMAAEGAILTTTEAALFEWCERAGNDEFKRVSAIVKNARDASN